MKTQKFTFLFLVLNLSMSSSVQARFLVGALSGDIDMTQEYACFGMDHIPLGKNTAIAAQCCNNGGMIDPAPEQCKAGFTTVIPHVANNVLNIVGVVEGLEYNPACPGCGLTNVPPPANVGNTSFGGSGGGSGITLSGSGIAQDVGGSGGIKPGTSQALWNQNDPNANGTAGGSLSIPKVGGKESGSTAGSGSGSGSGSGGGVAASVGGGDSGKQSAALGNPNNIAPNGEAYAAIDGGAGGGSGSNGFGGSGSGGGVGSGQAGELSFGEDSRTSNGNTVSNSDEDSQGSSLDPSDYFSRIDKSANLFRVVSARYMKKKSLWSPRKLPEKQI